MKSLRIAPSTFRSACILLVCQVFGISQAVSDTRNGRDFDVRNSDHTNSLLGSTILSPKKPPAGTTKYDLRDGQKSVLTPSQWNDYIKYNPDTFKGTKEDWEKALEDRTREYEKLTPTGRPYPFCVDGLLANGLEDPNLVRYRDLISSLYYQTSFTTKKGPKILEFVSEGERDYQLENNLRETDKNSDSIVNLFGLSIRMKRIKSPEHSNVKSPGIGELSRWIHFEVKSKVPLEGLFFQAIMAPLGIPFGQFRADFDCDNTDEAINNKRGSTAPQEDIDIADKVNEYIKYGQFGDFTSQVDWNLMDRQNVIPCKYKPRASIRHPSVYAYGGYLDPNRLPTERARSAFRFHFSYEDVQCHFVTKMQFLIIAVKSFEESGRKDFKQNVQFYRSRLFTPRFGWIQKVNNTEEHTYENEDGLPSPFFKLWDGVQCKRDFRTFIDDGLGVIFTNPDYDRCVTNRKGLILGNLCPPGPFECTTDMQYTNLADLVITQPTKDRSRNENIRYGHNNDTNPAATTLATIKSPNDGKPKTLRSISFQTTLPRNCVPLFCSPPNETYPRPPLSPIYPDDSLTISTLWKTSGRRVLRTIKSFAASHTTLMTLSWAFFTIGLGCLVARYMKETFGITYDCERQALGLGAWLWIHVVSMYLALMFMWMGVIEVLWIRQKPYPCEKYGEVYEAIHDFPTEEDNLMFQGCRSQRAGILGHKFLGWLSFLLFHLGMASGWIRPVADFPRLIFIWGHFVVGYSGKIFALLSVFCLIVWSPESCLEILVWQIVVELLLLGAFGFGQLLQRLEDKKFEIELRRVFPIVEGIEVPEQDRAPFTKLKLILVSVLAILIIGICLVQLVSYEGIYGNQASIVETFGNSGRFYKHKAILMDCKHRSLETEFKVSQILEE